MADRPPKSTRGSKSRKKMTPRTPPPPPPSSSVTTTKSKTTGGSTRSNSTIKRSNNHREERRRRQRRREEEEEEDEVSLNNAADEYTAPGAIAVEGTRRSSHNHNATHNSRTAAAFLISRPPPPIPEATPTTTTVISAQLVPDAEDVEELKEQLEAERRERERLERDRDNNKNNNNNNNNTASDGVVVSAVAVEDDDPNESRQRKKRTVGIIIFCGVIVLAAGISVGVVVASSSSSGGDGGGGGNQGPNLENSSPTPSPTSSKQQDEEGATNPPTTFQPDLELFGLFADNTLAAMRERTTDRTSDLTSLSTVVSSIGQNLGSSAWPYVFVEEFETLVASSAEGEIALCPLVRPEDQDSFEVFAYDRYSTVAGYPQGTALSSFGRGIWSIIDPEEDAPEGMSPVDFRYHDTDASSTTYGSPYEIFAPILQHSEGPVQELMYNLHSDEIRGMMIDKMLSCKKFKCGILSDIIVLADGRPFTLIMEPIYAFLLGGVEAIVIQEMVGLLSSSIDWRGELGSVFSSSTQVVSGIDCVFQTETQAYTFSVTEDIVSVKGEADLHDMKFEDAGRSVLLTSEGIFSSLSSPAYTLTIYPTDEFFLATQTV